MIRRDFVKSSLAVAALAAGKERLAASPRPVESAPFPKAPGLTKHVSEFIVKWPKQKAEGVIAFVKTLENAPDMAKRTALLTA